MEKAGSANLAPMREEGKNATVTVAGQPNHHALPPYYGTFQGVANFYPPVPPPDAVQPLPPPPHAYQYYYQGYHALPVYVVAEGQPIRERRLPCCGLGLGWLLFIMGFFIGGVPWYIGAFFLLCVRMDYREKPGLIACTLASLLIVIAVTFGAAHGNLVYLAKLT